MNVSSEKIKTYGIIGIAILIVVLFIGSCNRISTLKNDLAISEQNQKALADSLRFSKNKVGDLEASINILVAEKNNLKDLNKELADELKKEKGKVYELNQIIANYKPVIVEVPVDVIVYKPVNGDKQYGLLVKYDTIFDKYNYSKLEVETKFLIDSNFNVKPLTSTIKNNEIGFNLITGLRELDGNIEIFARSNHPYIGIIDMEGAIIDPKNHPVLKKFTKPKKFGISFFIGPAIGGNTNHVIGGVFVGAGLTYDLIQF